MGKVAEVGAWELEGRMQASVPGGLGVFEERADGRGRGQRSVHQRQGIQAPESAPPAQGQASTATGKAPPQMALLSHGSGDHAVPRHEQQKRAAVLVRFPKLSLASARTALGKRLLTTAFAGLARDSELEALAHTILAAQARRVRRLWASPAPTCSASGLQVLCKISPCHSRPRPPGSTRSS